MCFSTRVLSPYIFSFIASRMLLLTAIAASLFLRCMLRYRHQHKADDTKELKLGRSEKSAEWRAAALEQTLALTVRCLAWRDALIPTVVDDKFVLPGVAC